MPKVSILLPVHNEEEKIKRCIDSILSQTYQDFEVVIVDNLCDDKTISIVKEIKDDRIKIYQCATKGIVPALNYGLQKCSGDLIARQDADDYWYPNKLEKQVKFLEDREDISILGTQIKILDEKLNLKNEDFRYPVKDSAIKSWLLTGKNSIAHPSVVFRKNITLRVGGYDDSYPIAEDHHMWLRCIKWFNFANLSEILVDYTAVHNEKYDPKFPLLASEAQFKLLNYSGFIKVN